MKPVKDPTQFLARLMASGSALDRAQALSPQIYELLRQAIVTMALEPNDVIYERAIAEEFGISRTPVREALLRLSREELVVIVAQSGTFVAPVKRDQFIESAFIRTTLETAMVGRAAEIITDAEIDQLHDIYEAHRRAIQRENWVAAIRKDHEFHSTIGRAARLPKMLQMQELVRVPIDRVRHIAVREGIVAKVTLLQHEKILDALGKRDPLAAQAALREHLDDAFARQLQVFDDRTELFEG